MSSGEWAHQRSKQDDDDDLKEEEKEEPEMGGGGSVENGSSLVNGVASAATPTSQHPSTGPAPNRYPPDPRHHHHPSTGFYQAVYPPNDGNPYPPPRGYENTPYMPPGIPPYPYPMYPPYQPMYPPHYPPHHAMAPPYYSHPPVHQPTESQQLQTATPSQQGQLDNRYKGGGPNVHPLTMSYPAPLIPAPPPLPPESIDTTEEEHKPRARNEKIKDAELEQSGAASLPSVPVSTQASHPLSFIAVNKSRPRSLQGSQDVSSQSEDDRESQIIPGAVTARLKTYIKPRIPSTQEVLGRRSRKNAQSRARASKLRDRIIDIEMVSDSVRSEEEKRLFRQYENRRQRKNDRSRERALEKKEEIDRILSRPDRKRSKIEKQFLGTALVAKKRKNEGDRLRRQRLKDLGLSTKGASGIKPGISARGPLPVQYQDPQEIKTQQNKHFNDIPMSPLPTVPTHQSMQSPGAFATSNMIPNITFPSPSHPRRSADTAGHRDTENPRVRTNHSIGGGGQAQLLPFIPPSQEYDGQTPSPSMDQIHLSQHSSRVEQRRNPDGSMSISIGGRSTGGSSFGGETRLHQPSEEQSSVNISDVSHLLLYNDNEGDESEPVTHPNSEGKTE